MTIKPREFQKANVKCLFRIDLLKKKKSRDLHHLLVVKEHQGSSPVQHTGVPSF